MLSLQGVRHSEEFFDYRSSGPKPWLTSCVRRFVYANIPLYESEMEEFTEENLRNSEHSEPPASLPDRFEGARDSRTEERLDSYKPDDAWSTLLQWLYYRMEQIHAEFP